MKDVDHQNVLTNKTNRIGTFRVAAAVLGVPFAILLSALSVALPAHAQDKKPLVLADSNIMALLAEIRTRLVKSGTYSAAEIDGVIAELRNKNMDEIKAISDFAGKNPTGAERLIPGSGSEARDRAGELTGHSGGGSSGVSASERGINQALTPGINDRSGQTSDSCDACDAVSKETVWDWLTGSKQRNGADQLGTGEPKKYGDARRVKSNNGDTIDIYKDKSVSITRKDGSTEFLSSGQRLVDKNGNAKEPRPDGDKSGGFTISDLRRVIALLGQHSQPAGNDDTGSGGGLDGTKTNRTGTLGYFQEDGSRTYTSKADVKEIIRLSVEKLQGPRVVK